MLLANGTQTDHNIIGLTDSYKLSHYKQYPKGTSRVFSFFESRGGKWGEVVFFGLQYLLMKYLAGPVVTEEMIEEEAEMARLHLGNDAIFNEAGWRYILEEYGGCLPIEIRAIPEGTAVPGHNALMTVVNTDPRCYWLTNYVETLLVQSWYPSTVATQSREMKKIILQYLRRTGDPGQIDFKLHDFGFRGSTSVESSALGGAAHLVNFKGTDTMSALRLLRRYYGEEMAGYSIPAAEHSTITSWGREHEADAYRNMLEAYPTGLVACVSDSYDIFNACREIWGNELRKQVLERDGVLVVRPDSGEPKKVVVEVLEALGNRFGWSSNSAGYRELHPKVRVIQGDGIDYESIGEILGAMADVGWSANNIAFGSGGGLLQKLNRDTLKFAFKCSAVEVDGEWRNVMKDPITDPGKRSKAGRLGLVCRNGQYQTLTDVPDGENLLVPVFRNGEMLVEYNLADIRARAAL